MSRTKADFRALRETVGLSQQALADALGNDVRTIKSWEQVNRWNPPQDAWQYLDALKARQDEIVEFSVKKIMDMHLDLEQKPKSVIIKYYRTQAEYDEEGIDEGEYSVANASSRAVSLALGRAGYQVQFYYPAQEISMYSDDVIHLPVK